MKVLKSTCYNLSLIALQLLCITNNHNNNIVHSFTLPSSPSSLSYSHRINNKRHIWLLSIGDSTTSSNDTTGNTSAYLSKATSDAEQLRIQARRVKLEAEKMEAELTLQKIQALEEEIKLLTTMVSSSDYNDNSQKSKNKNNSKISVQERRREIQTQIQNLAKNIDPSLLASLPMTNFEIDDTDDEDNVNLQLQQQQQSQSQKVETNLYKSKNEAVAAASTTTKAAASNTPTIETNLYKNRTFQQPQPTLTEDELQSAVEYYISLPKPMKKVLANSIDLDDELTNASIIVLGLYEFMGTDNLNPDRLNRWYNNLLLQSSLQKGHMNNEDGTSTTLDEALSMLQRKMKDKGVNKTLQKLNNESKLESMIESFLPRVTRKEGKEPTLADINMLQNTQIFGKETFQLSTLPQQIPGGYLLRGEMAPKLRGDCDKLIEVIDSKIENSNKMPSDWNDKFQVNIMTDPTPQMLEDEESFDGEIVLVVHSRDMSPTTSQLLLSGVSTLSLFLSFVFVISTYSQNEVVMQRLTSANAIGDYDVTWFNELITPLLISIGVTQACHEAAHLFIAKKDGFKITPPTILPLVALPYLSFKQSIKTSPKNFQSLFNFGMIGPAVGMVVSAIFLFAGLQMTLTMDANAMEYAPAVPVFFIKSSTLGGTIVDNIVGGGQGIITQQDPLTPVKLHPFAIGGFASLMINCLDTIPLPGTDGGRMSQALLGRSGQVAFGGVVYFALLLYTVFSGHRDIFLAFLIINSIARQDNEVPCRNEIDKAGLGQAATALLMWSIAILTLTPID